jgi:Tol biopolymer transport system component
MLSRVSRSRPALTRRAAMLLLVAGAAACALPTLDIQPAAAEPAGAGEADKKLMGRLFLNVAVRDDDDKFESTIIAVDPATGKWERICEAAGAFRVRVSPDKETLAFAKHEDGVWTCAAQKDSSPGRIFDRGYLTGWSPDSKQIIVSDGKFEEGTGWKHEAWRMNANGTDVIKLSIPETDEVGDWSPDGKWIVTVSDRHEPKGSGYQLYVMKPDGSEERRITQGRGLNVYARFSPDSRKVVYTHQEKGVNSLRTVNLDGTETKEILKEEGLAGIEAACWSPDGKHLAVSRFDWELGDDGKKIRRAGADHNQRFEIMDADGKNGREMKLEDLKPIFAGHPEWR